MFFTDQNFNVSTNLYVSWLLAISWCVFSFTCSKFLKDFWQTNIGLMFELTILRRFNFTFTTWPAIPKKQATFCFAVLLPRASLVGLACLERPTWLIAVLFQDHMTIYMIPYLGRYHKLLLMNLEWISSEWTFFYTNEDEPPFFMLKSFSCYKASNAK